MFNIFVRIKFYFKISLISKKKYNIVDFNFVKKFESYMNLCFIKMLSFNFNKTVNRLLSCVRICVLLNLIIGFNNVFK